jgi:hypothetical protein
MKCPCCGYDNEKQYNPGAQIRKLLLERNKHTRKLLRIVTNKIQTSVTSDNSQQRYYTFLQSISKINDNIVSWSVDRFILDNHFSHTRGFSYLRAIIFNENKNRKKRLDNEYSRLGKPPSIKNPEEVNDG